MLLVPRWAGKVGQWQSVHAWHVWGKNRAADAIVQLASGRSISWRSLFMNCAMLIGSISTIEQPNKTVFSGSDEKLIQAAYFVLSILHAQLRRSILCDIDERIPLPKGVESTQSWGATEIVMPKFRGIHTFESLMEAAINGKPWCDEVLRLHQKQILARSHNVTSWGKSAREIPERQLRVSFRYHSTEHWGKSRNNDRRWFAQHQGASGNVILTSQRVKVAQAKLDNYCYAQRLYR